MTQKFKFGDRVRLRGGAFVLIFVAQQGSNDAAVICEGEAKAFSLPMQHLELIPHPDTVRLDFIQNNLMEIKLIENEDGQLFCIDKDGIWWEETFSETVRQSIDTMIREYEA